MATGAYAGFCSIKRTDQQKNTERQTIDFTAGTTRMTSRDINMTRTDIKSRIAIGLTVDCCFVLGLVSTGCPALCSEDM